MNRFAILTLLALSACAKPTWPYEPGHRAAPAGQLDISYCTKFKADPDRLNECDNEVLHNSAAVQAIAKKLVNPNHDAEIQARAAQMHADAPLISLTTQISDATVQQMWADERRNMIVARRCFQLGEQYRVDECVARNE